LGEEEAVPYLVGLTRDSDSQVQEAALTALGKIGTGEAKRVLRESVKGSDARLRDAALVALKEAESVDPFTLYE
jgi:HEAT repeat protein